jgi:radical SAM protein with 4Fe4S-binding SPASM domain
MPYPEIPTFDSTQYFDLFNRKINTQRIPVEGSMELTFRCNLRCVHCYCNLPPHDEDAIQQELRTDEVLNILDQVAEAGCLWLLFTGGEPLLRKDFNEIYTYAKKKGFIITLFTNGTRVTPEIADFLKAWPPHSVEITLYGATQETYEEITRVPRSYKRCLRGIDLLLEKGIPLSLKTMAMTLNEGELAHMKAFAEERGLKFRFDPMLNPRLDGTKGPCEFRLPPEKVIQLDLEYEERSNEWREFCKKFIAPFSSEYLFNCGAGISTYHIDPYGKMSACQMARFRSHDLRKAAFTEVWEDHTPTTLKLKPQGDYPCGRCELISLCGQCPGWAWLEKNDLEKPVEYLCRIAHLRADAFQGKTITREKVWKGTKWNGNLTSPLRFAR